MDKPHNTRDATRASMPPWLTVSDVARLVRVDVHTVLSWVKRGELRAVNVGSGRTKPRYRISTDAFDLWQAARTVEPPVRNARRKRQPNQHVIEFY